MKSLKETCMENICKSILSAPPLIQEEIISESLQKITTKIKDKVFMSAYETAEEVISDNLNNTLPWLVSEIVEDFRNATINIDVTKENFIEKYPSVEPYVIGIACNIANNIISNFEEQLIHTALPNANYYTNTDSEDDNDEPEYTDF
jgi:hypothetical protein